MRMPQLLVVALLAIPLAAVAAPELNIGGLYDYLDGDKSTLVKRVRNGGDTTAFVKVSVAELVYDEAGGRASTCWPAMARCCSSGRRSHAIKRWWGAMPGS